MPFTPLAHLFSVTQTLAQPNGDVCINVLHGRMNSGSIDESTADAIADAVRTSWYNHLRGWIGTGVTMQTYIIRDLSVVGGRTYYRTPSPAAGTSSSHMLPEQLAVCTTLNRGSGPSQRGRVYNGGFTIDALDSASGKPIVSAGAIADIDLWLEDTSAAFSDHSSTWVVYSRKLNSTADVDLTRTPTDQRWDVQRRRANHRPVV